MSGSQKQNKLIIGTWGLFNWAKENPSDVLKHAYSLGFKKYDTAAVYGSGDAEEELSKLPQDIEIHTKIPAKLHKNNLGSLPDVAYPNDYFEQALNQSLRRLKRQVIDVVYLHNWNFLCDTTDHFKKLFAKHQNKVISWGVSLPSNYSLNVDLETLNPLLELFDIFQIPYCASNPQNINIIKHLQKKRKRVILRSVLGHGVLIKKDNVLSDRNPSLQKYNPEERKKMRQSVEGNTIKDRLIYCLDSINSLGEVEVVLGVSKKKHLEILDQLK